MDINTAVINGVTLTEAQLREGLAQIEQKKQELNPAAVKGGERFKSGTSDRRQLSSELGVIYIAFDQEYQKRLKTLWPNISYTRSILAFEPMSGRIVILDLARYTRIKE